MRIIVAGPPKTGNTWMVCLLSKIYQLDVIKRSPRNIKEIKARIDKGKFPDQSIFHQHLNPTKALLRLADTYDCRFVTMLRDPYDTFVSLYFYAQNYPKLFRSERKLHAIVKKPIDHPDVLNFLGRTDRGYGSNLEKAVAWLSCPQTEIVRYEDLRADPLLELTRLTSKITPIPLEMIEDAIKGCSVEKMRQQNKRRARLIRKASTGDWKNHLSEVHLEIMRSNYADLIRKIGYEVR